LETTNGIAAKLPDVALPTIAGDPIELASLRGKRHLLFMWGSW
jgi:hypothetical protein